MRRSGIAAGRQPDNKSGGHEGITDAMGFAHSLGLPLAQLSNRFGRLFLGYAPRMPSPRDRRRSPAESTPE
jgi:hypothetical protein